MGLPLFVAPVESDLPSKAADASRNSPPRTSIRRHGRYARERERRADIMRRSNLIRERVETMRSSYSPFDDEPPRWADRERRQTRYPARFPDPEPEEDEREMVNAELGEAISRYHRWHPAPEEDDAVDLGWWSMTTRPRDLLESSTQPPEPNAVQPPPRQRSTTSSMRPAASSNSETSQSRRAAIRREATALASEYNAQSRSAILRSIRDINGLGVNGLGDRDRSLSPEVWDTLLTTLTPDPQPPSAGSSFASTVASQSAGVSGVSSGTSRTTPETREGIQTRGDGNVDPGCESGCENSDGAGAGPDDEPTSRRRRETRRSPRDGIPRENREILRRFSMRPATDNRRVRVEEPLLRSRWTSTEGQLDGFPDAFGRRGRGGISRSSMFETRQSEPSFDDLLSRGSNSGWVGQMSIGASDDEQMTERQRLNRESSSISANNTSQGEEDWSGMQRIVRSLARREDIPDEWWAEAGLSRTLPQDGTE